MMRPVERGGYEHTNQSDKEYTASARQAGQGWSDESTRLS